MHLHKYVTVDQTGKHHYQKCEKCNKKRIIQKFKGGYQPLLKGWVKDEIL